MKQKIKALLKQLNHGLVEREDILKTALLTVLAGENLLLIGPPGTGKSLVARRIAESLTPDSDKNGGYFEYLLTKFSTPEEIFGPLSITELKADRFKRNTAGYLPTVKIAFLDEIFKASSSILNALLTILNERIFHNGTERKNVPLESLIAASNELPTGQTELDALYDRFLVRCFVDYVSEDGLARLIEDADTLLETVQLAESDIANIRDAAKSVTIPPEIADAIQRIWLKHRETFKEDRRESLSDRRLKKVIELLRVSAAANGRNKIDLSDVFLLKDCLWNHPDNAIKVHELILKTLQTFSQPVPKSELTATTSAGDAAEKVLPTPMRSGGKLDAVVKGLKGSGTMQDPILIQSLNELMDLIRPEVGLAGYYFRQTADIDCSALSHFNKILFKGHYDGGGHSIKYKMVKNSCQDLFGEIQAQSDITNLKLEDLGLATTANDCHIAYCASSAHLIREKAINCTIKYCQSSSALVQGSASNCTIKS